MLLVCIQKWRACASHYLFCFVLNFFCGRLCSDLLSPPPPSNSFFLITTNRLYKVYPRLSTTNAPSSLDVFFFLVDDSGLFFFCNFNFQCFLRAHTTHDSPGFRWHSILTVVFWIYFLDNCTHVVHRTLQRMKIKRKTIRVAHRPSRHTYMRPPIENTFIYLYYFWIVAVVTVTVAVAAVWSRNLVYVNHRRDREE